MSLAAPPPARLKARTEFSVTLDVPATSADGVYYRFEYREASEATWTNARTVETKPGDAVVLLDDLNPTSTYEIRIYAVKKLGDEVQVSPPSEVAAVDTEVPGCTPDPKCVMM